MVQPHHNFAPYLQIETKFMTRNKIYFYRFIYFSKCFGKMPNTNPFVLTVKAGRNLATHPDILILFGKNSVDATVLVAIGSTN